MTAADARQTLLDEVTRQQAELDRWNSAAAEHEAEARQARAGMGAAIADDPAAADQIGPLLRSLDDKVQAARQAATVIQPRLAAAKRAVLEFDAAQLDAEADVLEADLVEHRAKTDRLLRSLAKHEGTFALEQELVPAGSDLGMMLVPKVRPRSADMELELARGRLRADVLRELAAGRDPKAGNYPTDAEAGVLTRLRDVHDGLVLGLPADNYFSPVTWGPGAVVPAPAFEKRVEQARARLEQHDLDIDNRDQLLREKQARLAEVEAALEAQPPTRNRQPTQERLDLGSSATSLTRWIRELRAEQAMAPQERARLVAELAELTGEHEHAAA